MRVHHSVLILSVVYVLPVGAGLCSLRENGTVDGDARGRFLCCACACAHGYCNTTEGTSLTIDVTGDVFPGATLRLSVHCRTDLRGFLLVASTGAFNAMDDMGHSCDSSLSTFTSKWLVA